MRTTTVYKILNSSNLFRNGNNFFNETHVFNVHFQDVDKKKVLFVRIIKKGPNGDVDYVNDVDNSVFVKTLKELKQRVA